jgi:hypothetical protein
VRPLVTSAAVNWIEPPLKVLWSRLSVIVAYPGNPLMLTVTESLELGTLTPRPSETEWPGLTDSEWSATLRLGAVVVVELPDPLVLPDEVEPVGSVAVVPPDDVPPEAVVLPDDVEPVDVDPVVLPDVVPDEEVPPDDVPPAAVVLPDDVPDEEVLPDDVVPPEAVVVVPDDVVPPVVVPVVLPDVVPDEEVPLDDVPPEVVVVCRPGGGSAVSCAALSEE